MVYFKASASQVQFLILVAFLFKRHHSNPCKSFTEIHAKQSIPRFVPIEGNFELAERNVGEYIRWLVARIFFKALQIKSGHVQIVNQTLSSLNLIHIVYFAGNVFYMLLWTHAIHLHLKSLHDYFKKRGLILKISI